MTAKMININGVKMGLLLSLLLLLTYISRSSEATASEAAEDEEKYSRSSKHSDSGAIDDPVLYLAYQRHRQKTLGVAPDIPALTDQSFPATVRDVKASVVVVLFYIPFDPLGMLFLDQYQEAGRELAARTGSNSSHPLFRINCYDWTDVCRKENVTIYPIIHIYQRGKWREQYRGAFDRDVLVRSVSLLQYGQPLWLRKGEEEVRDFVDGHVPDSVHPLVDNLVLLKPSASLTEVAAFTEVARQLETQMLFAIVSPDIQTHIGVEVGVLHVRRTDRQQPYDTLTQPLDAPSIRHFLLRGKFPLLPELTFLNFPELQGRGHPLGILFLDPAHPQAYMHVRAVVDVIRSGHVKNVTFCTLGVDGQNDMSIRLLRTYTGRSHTPVFVLVNLRQRTVFTFSQWTLTQKNLLAWFMSIQAGHLSPHSYLAHREWKAPSRHIDFLEKMDREEREREEREKRHQTALHNQQTLHSDDFQDRGWVREPEYDDVTDSVVDEEHYFYPDDVSLPQQKLLEHQLKLKMDQHKPNQDQPYPNQNQHDWEQNQNVHHPNQNQHRRNENEHKDVTENQKSRPKKSLNKNLKNKEDNMGGKVENVPLESDREKKMKFSPSSAGKESARALPEDVKNMKKEREQNMKRLNLHTEL